MCVTSSMLVYGQVCLGVVFSVLFFHSGREARGDCLCLDGLELLEYHFPVLLRSGEYLKFFCNWSLTPDWFFWLVVTGPF